MLFVSAAAAVAGLPCCSVTARVHAGKGSAAAGMSCLLLVVCVRCEDPGGVHMQS